MEGPGRRRMHLCILYGLDQNPLVNSCSDFRVQCRETVGRVTVGEARSPCPGAHPGFGPGPWSLPLALLALSTSGGHMPPAHPRTPVFCPHTCFTNGPTFLQEATPPPSSLLTLWEEAVLLPPSTRLTLSLFSFRLTMTAVICWSMKIRMVTSRAGRMLARYTHHGFFPKGATNQPRSGRVG